MSMPTASHDRHSRMACLLTRHISTRKEKSCKELSTLSKTCRMSLLLVQNAHGTWLHAAIFPCTQAPLFHALGCNAKSKFVCVCGGRSVRQKRRLDGCHNRRRIPSFHLETVRRESQKGCAKIYIVGRKGGLLHPARSTVWLSDFTIATVHTDGWQSTTHSEG